MKVNLTGSKDSGFPASFFTGVFVIVDLKYVF